MHDSRKHEEVTTGIPDFPSELQSFLKVSACYFGLVDVPPELRHRHAAPTQKEAGSGFKLIGKQIVTQRGTA